MWPWAAFPAIGSVGFRGEIEGGEIEGGQTEVEKVDTATQHDGRLHELARARLLKRREFVAHLFAYLLVNAFLMAIWVITGAGFFWPAFPILGWGIGLFFHGWDTFSAPLSEARIEREVARLRRESGEG